MFSRYFSTQRDSPSPSRLRQLWSLAFDDVLRSCLSCTRAEYEEMVRSDIRDVLCHLTAGLLDLDHDDVAAGAVWELPDDVAAWFNTQTEVAGIFHADGCDWLLVHVRRNFLVGPLESFRFLEKTSLSDQSRIARMVDAASVAISGSPDTDSTDAGVSPAGA